MIPAGYMAKRVYKRPDRSRHPTALRFIQLAAAFPKISPTTLTIGSTMAIGSLTRQNS
jgi:hypothetical protein